MGKLAVVTCAGTGALIGFVASLHDDALTQGIMMGIGALFGAPLGAAFGKRACKAENEADDSLLPGSGTTPKDLAANFWRDKGHPPFMKPDDNKPDSHVHDPDKLG